MTGATPAGRAWGVSGRPALGSARKVAGQIAQHRRLEDGANGQFAPQTSANLRGQTRSQQRVAAQMEEIVGQPHACRRLRKTVVVLGAVTLGTTPALGAPPLLNQEGSFGIHSPPQLRRGGAWGAGVVGRLVAVFRQFYLDPEVPLPGGKAESPPPCQAPRSPRPNPTPPARAAPRGQACHSPSAATPAIPQKPPEPYTPAAAPEPVAQTCGSSDLAN